MCFMKSCLEDKCDHFHLIAIVRHTLFHVDVIKCVCVIDM